MNWPSIITPLASLLIAFLFMQFFRGFDFAFGRSAVTRLERFAVVDNRGLTDRIGDSIVDRFGLSLQAWEHELLWAQLGGFYSDKTVGSVLGRSILFAGAGLMYIMLFKAYSPFFLLGLSVAAYYPYMQLHGRAEDVRAAVKRGLPEAAALIAAEMSAGSSAETSVTRA